MSEFDDIKKFLDEKKIVYFKNHALMRMKDRPISKKLIFQRLKPEHLLHVEYQGGDKYKVWLKMSNRFKLVLVISITK